MYTVDIDIGGTLTDGLVSDGRQVLAVKVDTTPHDFTVCFFDCLREAATTLGFADLTAFLDQVEIIRWSSTISTNVLAERKGPRIGLLGAQGMGLGLYGSDLSPAVNHVVDAGSITEVAEPLQRDDVLTKVRELLERGARRICVSLEGAYDDPSREVQVKRWITDQYPDHFLGAVPALAGTDMIVHPDDQTRTHMALVNAYVHTPLAVALFKAEEELLRIYGYRHPLYIGHVSGGVARVAKTKGFDTLESGPVFGVTASSYFASRSEDQKVLALDVGGTTAKLALVVEGRPLNSERTDMFGIPIETPWILLRSVALGGGSVARAQHDAVVLGPESMGAFPGPACYNLGGDQPTLTDAFVVAGLLDPDNFLGGKRRLDVEAARKALSIHVGDPLAISVEEAAARVIDEALEMLARAARALLEEAGQSLDGFHLHGFGGNGALLAAAVAERVGIQSATVFRLGHVLSAFGSSVSDVCHVEAEWPCLDLDEPASIEALASRIESVRERVRRDLEGERADMSKVGYSIDALVGRNGSREVVSVPLGDDAGAAAADLARNTSRVEQVAVRGVIPTPHFEPEAEAGPHHDAVRTATRATRFGSSPTESAIYHWDDLAPGATFAGPAVVQSSANTSVVPPGWRFTVDGLGNGRMIFEGMQR